MFFFGDFLNSLTVKGVKCPGGGDGEHFIWRTGELFPLPLERTLFPELDAIVVVIESNTEPFNELDIRLFGEWRFMIADRTVDGLVGGDTIEFDISPRTKLFAE